MFALRAEYEAALIQERTQAGLVAARAHGRHSGHKPKMTPRWSTKPSGCTTHTASLWPR